MSTIVRIANAAALTALTLAVALPSQPSIGLFDGHACMDQTQCARNAAIGPMVDEMLAEQVAHFRCVPAAKAQIPSSALVRNAKGFDSGVVYAASFDTAWSGAKAGRVVVVRWCK